MRITPGRFLAAGLYPTGLFAAGVAVFSLVQPTVVAAQVRGLPTLFEPSYGYDTRLGLDLGWWGETGGTTISANAAHQIFIGNCERVALGVYVNAHDVGGQARMLGGAAMSGAVMVLPCPMANSIVNPSLWIIGGVGAVNTGGSRRVNALIGLGAGYILDEFAVVKIEPHATAAMHHREDLVDPDESSWKPDFSLGLNLGVGAGFGIRTAIGCCIDGLSFTAGLSLWE